MKHEMSNEHKHSSFQAFWVLINLSFHGIYALINHTYCPIHITLMVAMFSAIWYYCLVSLAKM